MRFTIGDDTSGIPRLAEQLEAYLSEQGIAMAVIMSLNLCLDELLTNTIQYGFAADGGNDHEISVDISVADDVMTVEIIDNAPPFDPTRDSEAPDLDASLDERRIGGLGIHLARTLSDSMCYWRDEQGRNRLVMTKRL